MCRTLAIMILVAITAATSNSQVPESLTFQGFLTNEVGESFDSTLSMSFRLYKGSTEIWSETHPGVVVSDGVFSVVLGLVTPLDTISFDRPIDLGVTPGDDPELVQRTTLGSVGYALGIRGLRAVWADDGTNQAFNLIGGAANNKVASDVVGATIGGGGGWYDAVGKPDSVLGNWGTVSGGRANVATAFSAVGGGQNNAARAFYSTVGGGDLNTASGNRSTVGGGGTNLASGHRSTVSGGNVNQATGSRSTVSGGGYNVASGDNSTVPGGSENVAAGNNSLAAGFFAKALHHGSFVWADRSIDLGFGTTDDHQFLIRAVGGVGIGTNAPGSNADGFTANGALLDVRQGTGPAAHFGNDDGSGLPGPTLRVHNVSTGSGIAGWIISEGTDATLIVQNNGPGDILTAWAGGDRRVRITTHGEVYADSTFKPTGADVAEAVDVSGLPESYEPGDVLVISDDADRTVELSSGSFSTRVAGVFATSPGMVLSEQKMENRSPSRIPVGIVGIVPTKVTTENGPIRRGDLLVTSSTSGHAMRADSERIVAGALLGKAMEAFDESGIGRIDVLLTIR